MYSFLVLPHRFKEDENKTYKSIQDEKDNSVRP
ncbi:MAG: hypothetical protein RL131_1494, partial [Bacteroidota bacterium]